MVRIIWILVCLLVSGSPVMGQDEVTDLAAEIESGNVVVNYLNGNGSSSGPALEGQLHNITQKVLRIATNLSRPLFLGNRGRDSGQNMIAVRVYGEGGAYYSDGENNFIEIQPNEIIPIQLTAYCADFDKDNPAYSDNFEISEMPQEIADIAVKISRYVAANPDLDLTVPSQIALWLSQGNSASDIQEKFPFSAADANIAEEIMSQPL